jgi:hypothetical protein
MMKRALLVIAFWGLFVHVSGGTWAMTGFGNDAALDWVENSLKPSGAPAVKSAIFNVLRSQGYLDADRCCVAIAACEVLAAARGRRGADLPEEVAAIAEELPAKFVEALREDGRKCLDRILTDSELRELWADAKQLPGWEKTMRELQSRM